MIFGYFKDFANANTIEEEQYLNLIEIGEKILFKMSNRY